MAKFKPNEEKIVKHIVLEWMESILETDQPPVQRLRETQLIELTIYHAKSARDTLLPYTTATEDVALDLSAVEEFDTVGLQLILSLKKQLALNGVGLIIARASDAVKKLLAVYFLNLELEALAGG